MVRLAAIFVVFLAVGCASIVSTNSRQVTVTSNPIGADVLISRLDGEAIYRGTTPTTLSLETGAGFFVGREYDVTVTSAEFGERTTRLLSRVNGWYFGNILFGGLIGLLLVDPATGAMFTLSKTSVTVDFVAPPEAEEPVDESEYLSREELQEIGQYGRIRR